MKRVFLSLVVILVLLVGIAWFSLSPLVTWLANKKLPELLRTEASVGEVVVDLLHGTASIHDLHIGQPDGFGEDALIELGRVMAQVDIKSITSGDGILIHAVELERLNAHVVKSADGAINVLQLTPPPQESAEPANAPAGEVEPAEENAPFPPIRIERVSVDGVTVHYTDHTAGARPVEIRLGNLGLVLANGLVELGDLPNLTLGEGRLTLEDLHIAQPDDFGDDALLALPSLQLDLGSEPFVDGIVRLQALELTGLRAHIMRDMNGLINASRLGGGPPPPPPTPGQPADALAENVEPDAQDVADTDGPAPEPPSESAASPIGIHLEHLTLTDFGVTYTDATLGKAKGMEFVIHDLGLDITDLMAMLAEPPVEFSSIDLSAALVQGIHPDARLSLLAALGPVSAGVPNLNAQLKLTGLMLDTLGSLLPHGVRQTLGAHGADLELALALNPVSIDVDGILETDAGHSYDLVVHGPLSHPTVDLGPLMFAVAGRVVGGVANLATGSAGAALDVAEGVTGGAKELTKGAGGLLRNVGGGLMKTATGALSGDLDQVGEGVRGATSSAVKDAASSVGDATGAAVSEAKEGVKSATGSKRTTVWQEALSGRHQEDMAAAREALAAMPFPPPDVSGAADDGR